MTACKPLLSFASKGCKSLLTGITVLTFYRKCIASVRDLRSCCIENLFVVYRFLTLITESSNTYAGITEVDKSVVEAARGMGMKSGQILFKV
ncbi:hypothetical protein ACQKI4_32285, partial [Paenibacillus glucanolyticus]